jgi:Domain of unknown function (DUF1844)
MAEVQRSTNIGEMSQRFIEFILMQAENAALMLGLRPHPATGRPEKNLEMARIFIDQLEMVREKTRGNLTAEETKVLSKMLGDLQFAYVRVSGDITAYDSASMPKDENDLASTELDTEGLPPEPPAPAPAAPQSAAPAEKTPAAAQPGPVESAPETENKKRFTKSYG